MPVIVGHTSFAGHLRMHSCWSKATSGSRAGQHSATVTLIASLLQSQHASAGNQTSVLGATFSVRP